MHKNNQVDLPTIDGTQLRRAGCVIRHYAQRKTDERLLSDSYQAMADSMECMKLDADYEEIRVSKKYESASALSGARQMRVKRTRLALG